MRQSVKIAIAAGAATTVAGLLYWLNTRHTASSSTASPSVGTDSSTQRGTGAPTKSPRTAAEAPISALAESITATTDPHVLAEHLLTFLHTTPDTWDIDVLDAVCASVTGQAAHSMCRQPARPRYVACHAILVAIACWW